jgi:hypothetical protein
MKQYRRDQGIKKEPMDGIAKARVCSFKTVTVGAHDHWYELIGIFLRLHEVHSTEKFVGAERIDELAPVVGMEPANHKGKLLQHSLKNRHQPRFPDVRHRADYLPLRHLIDSIDVIHPFGILPVSLVHRVHANVPRPPFRFRTPRNLLRCSLPRMPGSAPSSTSLHPAR